MSMMTSSATSDLFYRHLEAEDICPKMAKTADRRDRTCWVPSQEVDQIWDPGRGRAEAEVQHISANSDYCVTSFKKLYHDFPEPELTMNDSGAKLWVLSINTSLEQLSQVLSELISYQNHILEIFYQQLEVLIINNLFF